MQEQQQAMHAGLKEIWAALQKALTQKQKQQQQKQQQQQQQPVQQSSSSTSPYVAEKPYSWLLSASLGGRRRSAASF